MMSMFRTWSQFILWALLMVCLSAFVLTGLYFVYKGITT
jgi:hypothetical protein